MKKYSIIIPTLNEEKLLPHLLKKLNEKDLKEKYNFEIIISDGGSNDNTIEIASKYADHVVQKKNGTKQNISMGRNLGAKTASGDIFIFYNGDILPDNMNNVFETIKNKFMNSSYGAMTCCVKVFPNEEKIIDKIFQTFYNYYFHFLNVIGMGMGRG